MNEKELWRNAKKLCRRERERDRDVGSGEVKSERGTARDAILNIFFRIVDFHSHVFPFFFCSLILNFSICLISHDDSGWGNDDNKVILSDNKKNSLLNYQPTYMWN